MGKLISFIRKNLLLYAVFSAATFAISFVLGYAITSTLGPGTSGIVTIIFTTIIMVIGAKIIGKPPAFIIMVTLFTIMAIPTNMFGPPHPYKVVIGLITGGSYDFFWWFFRYTKFSLPIAAGLSTAVSIILIYFLMLQLQHPRAEYMAGILLYIIPLYAVLGFIGGWLGIRIYEKYIRDLSVTRQLSNEEEKTLVETKNDEINEKTEENNVAK